MVGAVVEWVKASSPGSEEPGTRWFQPQCQHVTSGRAEEEDLKGKKTEGVSWYEEAYYYIQL